MSLTNSTRFRMPPNSSSDSQTPSNNEVETQFSTQVELKNITLKKRGENSTKKNDEFTFQLKMIHFSLIHDLISQWIQ